MKRRAVQVLAGAVAAALTLCACETVNKVTQAGTGALAASGVLTEQQAQSINHSTEAIAKTFQDITPEQEYYIGRSVAATVLTAYKPFDAPAANTYLNELGQSLALFSDKPETFGGYHFLVMNSEEVNAFSAPGGLVLVSRGLVRCCRSEDALAAVLAHEIGHVEKQHGLRAIRSGRLTSALTILAVEAGKNLGGQNLAEVTQAFEGSITDITSTMMNSGYARSQEFEADAAAVQIMRRVGYQPAALVDMLEQMKLHLKPGGHDFAKTHPPPEDRIRQLRGQLGGAPAAAPAVRQQRFANFMRNI